MSDIKTRARDRARAARLGAARACPDAGGRIVDHFFQLAQAVGPARMGGSIAGYKPVGSEADVWPLMERLDGRGVVCGLPVVQSRSTPLQFRRWRAGDALVPGLHNTLQPGVEAETVRPDVVLTPLLAFDATGYRLGQGGGYYDRTLAALRRSGNVMVIGIALSAQEVEAVPRSGHDEPLDGVATEAGWRLFEGRSVR